MKRFEAYREIRELCNQKKTGKYVFTANAGKRTVTLYLKNGEIYAHHTSSTPNTLRRLYTAQLLTQEEYTQKTAEKNETLNDLYTSLQQLVTQQTLDTITREQLLSNLNTVTQWRNSTQTFTENTLAENTPTITPINFNEIEQAVYRRKTYVDALWKTISPNLPMTKCAPTQNSNYTENFDTPDMETLYNLIDGKRTIDKLSQQSGMTRTETAHTIWMLIQTGAISIPEETYNGVEPAEYTQIKRDLQEAIQVVKQQYSTTTIASPTTTQNYPTNETANTIPKPVKKLLTKPTPPTYTETPTTLPTQPQNTPKTLTTTMRNELYNLINELETAIKETTEHISSLTALNTKNQRILNQARSILSNETQL